jgi:type II secretory pathway component PulJ
VKPGHTLPEIAVVIGASALLALITFSVMSSVASQQNTRRTLCSNHARQMVLAMAVYQGDNNQAWPVRLTGPDGRPARAGMAIDDRLTTVASLEFLAVFSGGDLTPKIFICPAAQPRPTLPPSEPGIASGGPDDRSAWALAAPAVQPHYAYDWTVAKSAAANRAVVGCRPLTATTTQHTSGRRMQALVVYADGHTGRLPESLPGTGQRTRARDGQPYGNAHFEPSSGDDVFGDDGTPALPDAGSPTSAWLR